MFASSVENGMLWPQAIAGVVRPARVSTTPRWLAPALASLSKEGSSSRTCVAACSFNHGFLFRSIAPADFFVGHESGYSLLLTSAVLIASLVPRETPVPVQLRNPGNPLDQ